MFGPLTNPIKKRTLKACNIRSLALRQGISSQRRSGARSDGVWVQEEVSQHWFLVRVSNLATTYVQKSFAPKNRVPREYVFSSQLGRITRSLVFSAPVSTLPEAMRCPIARSHVLLRILALALPEPRARQLRSAPRTIHVLHWKILVRVGSCEPTLYEFPVIITIAPVAPRTRLALSLSPQLGKLVPFVSTISPFLPPFALTLAHESQPLLKLFRHRLAGLPRSLLHCFPNLFTHQPQILIYPDDLLAVSAHFSSMFATIMSLQPPFFVFSAMKLSVIVCLTRN